MDLLVYLVVWLNSAANVLGSWVFAPIGRLPGWLSATVVSVATGVVMLVVYKYTSNQHAIKRVRDDIKAQLLTLKLFKDSALVALRAQGLLLADAVKLLVFSLVPMLVMFVPVFLILGQLAPWYQSRPLKIGEETVLTLKLNGTADSPWPQVSLEPTPAAEVLVGPVAVRSQREICWNIKARADGYHRLTFHVDQQTADKELAIGAGFMRVSTERPNWDWLEALLHPTEAPFRADDAIQSISIEYPDRSSWTSGTDYWVGYWFVVSFIAALCLRRALNVNI